MKPEIELPVLTLSNLKSDEPSMYVRFGGKATFLGTIPRHIYSQEFGRIKQSFDGINAELARLSAEVAEQKSRLENVRPIIEIVQLILSNAVILDGPNNYEGRLKKAMETYRALKSGEVETDA